VSHPYLGLTDDDRQAMLDTIGVASVDELFREIPAGVRFDRPLDVAPALTEHELSASWLRATSTRRTRSRSSAPASTTTTSPPSSTPCSSAASS
jgi:glycine cleavage system pyridoxal-binding protein P